MVGQNMEQKKLFHCEDCTKSYTTRSNLNFHIKRIHPEKTSALNLKGSFIFKCVTCEKEYSSKQMLKQHGSKANHPAVNEDTEVTKTLYTCKLCQHTTTKANLLMNHIQSSHNINVEKELLKFNTFKEFEIWKNDMEQATTALFVKRRSYNSLNCATIIFQCNRSGFYVCKSTGKRHMKVQGSNKINTYCPATITLKQRGEECEVEFTKTHFGHDNNLKHLHLSKINREKIATKLAAKIPFKVIMDDIKDNVDITNVRRIDLVTHKDLQNIQASYKLKSTAVRDENDTIKCVKDTRYKKGEKQFIAEFIEVYRGLPALWDVKSKDYSNRAKKREQYDVLIGKYREKFPDADIQEVVKKINSLRTNFRKELKRIRDAEKSGAGAEDVEPSLWYFDEMRFLQTQETPTGSISTIDISQNNIVVANNEPRQTNRRRKSPDTTDKLASQRLQEPQDDSDKIAAAWAVELRKMDPQQQLFAKKAISDILFEGQMGTLHRNSVEINSSRVSIP